MQKRASWPIHLHRILLLASFSIWFGGFGFYTSVVVPIGTEVLGSPFAQGMITRQVTQWLNLFSGIAFGMILLELAFGWREIPKVNWRAQLTLCILMIACLIALVALHPMLDSMLDAQAGSVSDSDKFYDLHRVYLWVSTIQWLAAWIWLVLLVVGWRNHHNRQASQSGAH